MNRYRYDYTYGYWSSGSSSDGGYSYRPNVGEGGRDTGFAPVLPPPSPPPPPDPVLTTLVSTTPAVVTMTEADEYSFTGGGYKPSGQFTEARACALSNVNVTQNGVTKLCMVLNERTNYDYAPLAEETLRFPYWVPLNADLNTLPLPIITWQAAISDETPGHPPITGVVYVFNATDRGEAQTWAYNVPTGNSLVFTSGTKQFTCKRTQMLNFVKGQFNDFTFELGLDTSKLRTSAACGLQFCITDIQTSVPTGYEFEFKLQKNWESYFNIRVVKDTDRNQKGTATGVSTITTATKRVNTAALASTNSTWTWNNYNTSQGYKHWEIPVSTFIGNKQFNLPIIIFPENDDFCSMEPAPKTPGPKAPWNLVSRHESFYYAPTFMRKTDYPQNIGTNPTFYCPWNYRGVVWLKNGIANNDVL